MLILSRRAGERIILTVPASGKPQIIEVLYCRTAGESVRIGIEADKAVNIVRAELVTSGVEYDAKVEGEYA